MIRACPASLLPSLPHSMGSWQAKNKGGLENEGRQVIPNLQDNFLPNIQDFVFLLSAFPAGMSMAQLCPNRGIIHPKTGVHLPTPREQSGAPWDTRATPHETQHPPKHAETAFPV